MGLKYNKNDGQLLSSALKHNLEIADQIVEDVQEGVNHLLSMIDDPFGPLEGQAYHAASTLFQEIVKPTLTKLKEATNEIKGELTTFDNARQSFNSFPDTVYDMDDFKEHLEIKKQQRATVDFQMKMFNDLLVTSIAKKAVEDFVYEGQRLQSVANHYEQEIQEIEAKIRILEEFSSATASLFQESLHTFQNAMNGAKALKTGSFDSHGNFSMSSSSDLSWYKKITGKDISRDLLHEPSHLTASDIEEQEVANMNAETKSDLEQIAKVTGLKISEVIAIYAKAQRENGVKAINQLENVIAFIKNEFKKLNPDLDWNEKANWEAYGRKYLEDNGIYFDNNKFEYVVDYAAVIENILKNGIKAGFEQYKSNKEGKGKLGDNSLEQGIYGNNMKPDFDPAP